MKLFNDLQRLSVLGSKENIIKLPFFFFFFNVERSYSGQLASSWCTNIIFSRTAFGSPIKVVFFLSMSAHLAKANFLPSVTINRLKDTLNCLPSDNHLSSSPSSSSSRCSLYLLFISSYYLLFFYNFYFIEFRAWALLLLIFFLASLFAKARLKKSSNITSALM